MRWLLLLTLLQIAASCGQKGPLVRPENALHSHWGHSGHWAAVVSER